MASYDSLPEPWREAGSLVASQVMETMSIQELLQQAEQSPKQVIGFPGMS